MKVLVGITSVIIVLVIMSLLFALPVMWLWNWLMPDIFGLIEISFWQALGINMLSGILFRKDSSNNKD